jgi:hypothetical protein
MQIGLGLGLVGGGGEGAGGGVILRIKESVGVNNYLF